MQRQYSTNDGGGKGGIFVVPFQESAAGISLRQFLQKYIDIQETMHDNQFDGSGFKEKEYEALNYLRLFLKNPPMQKLCRAYGKDLIFAF